MAAALPHIDRFIEGHSYASLEQLAAILSGADPRRSNGAGRARQEVSR
jgi:uncharacterized protein with von Willebrand factor type A (vWA) domain